MNNSHAYRDSAQTFFLGLMAGGAAAVLFAPLTGSETRHRIKGAVQIRTDAVTKEIREKAIATRDRTNGLMAGCKATLSLEKSRITSALDAARNAYVRTASR
ncbi:MAG: YtxH domain-containing protein [Acidobacteria bacterium]|nr:YtxH domain-containing protein [Acidobacteriota bacterium]